MSRFHYGEASLSCPPNTHTNSILETNLKLDRELHTDAYVNIRGGA
jgi:hypothetical protein